ncbi:MAG TPA: D-alanyl-D-alanine carboxypeptidase [Clostridium sp.]|nr:D-alanyl-D-alanine carboxypeptidase [Clostridium sp. Bc-iso-3]HHV29461.1 D-alanyl-D-alanine carboxypeptidase [Clostridium sp.]
MYKKILLQIQCLTVVMLVLFSFVGSAFGVGEVPEIMAPSAILTEVQRGQILYAKNPNEKLHVSSANKIMTGLIALEKMQNQLDTKVTVSKKAVSVEGSVLNLEVGGKYPIEDLIYSVLLGSANDSANVLAEHIGGDEKGFVELMNKKARELEMEDTYFTNPTGLYDEEQYTTAYDLAILIRYAISKSNIFDEIFSTKARPWVDGTQILINSNELFWSYDGVDGGKTGYNEKHRQTAITTATRNGQRMICIVLDSPEESLYDDSVKLLDYGFLNYRTGILVSLGQPLKKVSVGDKSIDLVSIRDYYYTYPAGENYIKDIEFKVAENLTPPVLKSDVLGIAKYILEDGTIIEVSLHPAVDVYSSVGWFESLLNQVKEYRDIAILLCILLVVEIIIILNHIVKLIKRLFFKINNKSGSN